MRNKRLCLFVFQLFLIFASALPAFSQEDEGWYWNKPIKTVTFQGLSSVKNSDLEGITSAFVGKNLTEDVFADLLNRVFALNYFDDVTPKAIPGDQNRNTVNIVLVVKEAPSVTKIEYKGNNQVRMAELKEVTSIKEKDIFSESKVLLDERAIRDYYINKGYTAVKVSSVCEKNDSGVTVTFNISEGKQTVVASIKFEGNVIVTEKTLKSKLSLKEAGVFQKGEFQESSLEQDKLTINSYYHNRGYIEASVLDVKQERNYNEEKQRDELTITFVIQEGTQYTFGGITFTGNKIFSTEQLQGLVKLKAGDLYNETKLQESFYAIQNLYYENGYTANQFIPHVQKNSEDRLISYSLQIVENARSHVEHIIIKGNSKTKEDVIRREIPIEDGDIFSNTKVYTGLRNLYNLQYFSNVLPEVTPGSEANLVDIVFNVEETSTTTLDFGFTFSGVSDPEQFPIAIFAKVTDSNLFGEGRSVSASLNLSTTEQSASLGYGQNWLFGLPITFQASLSYAHESNYTLINELMPDGTTDDDTYYMEYQSHDFTFSVGVGRRWTPDWAIINATTGVSSSLINNIYDSTLYTPIDSSISDYNNNWEPRNSIFGSVSIDDRDVNYDPTNGWFVSQRLAWYGLMPEGFLPFAPEWGETQFYLKSDTKAEAYKTLCNIPVSDTYNIKLILMGYTGLSMEFPAFDSTIKKANQLYIDGMFAGRGWYIYNIKRGKALWNNTVELRYPAVPGILALDLFFDASMIKSSVSDVFTDFGNLDDWYFSFGPSIRFTIQQFPIRLLFTSTFQAGENGIIWEDRYGSEVDNFWESLHFKLSFSVPNR